MREAGQAASLLAEQRSKALVYTWLEIVVWSRGAWLRRIQRP